MAFTSKPTAVPEWATGDVVDGVTGQNNVVEPPAAKKLSGWAWQEKPARNWWNWMQRFNYLWINYFNQFFSTTHQFKIDEIIENTTNNGVDIEGVHFEDDIITVDTINELTTNNGVDIEGVHFENNAINGTYHIYTQAQFNTVIERVAANQYKVNDSIVALIINNLSGGYQMSSVLSGGDTWGYIETNNCVSIEFINGSFIDFENERGYIEINTDGCYIKNGDTQGTGTVASAITQSWLLNASRVTFDNCKCSNRLSNTTMVGFQGSGTTLHNTTSKYLNCSVYSISGSSGTGGFKDCKNINNTLIYDIESTGGNVWGMHTCENITNSNLSKFDSIANCRGFDACDRINSFVIEDLDVSDVGSCVGLNNCRNISSGLIEDLDSALGSVIGLQQCFQVSSVEIKDLEGATEAKGIVNGINITACEISSITGDTNVYGIDTTINVTGCRIITVTSSSGLAVGMIDCDHIAGNYITGITGSTAGDGIRSCNYCAAMNINEATNPSNDYVDTVDAQITNKVSCPSVFT